MHQVGGADQGNEQATHSTPWIARLYLIPPCSSIIYGLVSGITRILLPCRDTLKEYRRTHDARAGQHFALASSGSQDDLTTKASIALASFSVLGAASEPGHLHCVGILAGLFMIVMGLLGVWQIHCHTNRAIDHFEQIRLLEAMINQQVPGLNGLAITTTHATPTLRNRSTLPWQVQHACLVVLALVVIMWSLL